MVDDTVLIHKGIIPFIIDHKIYSFRLARLSGHLTKIMV